MTKIAIIDGKSVFYRGYYAMPNLSLTDGTPTGGVFGFASILLACLEELQPDNIYVTWDKKGTSTAKRTAIYEQYKSGRKAPPEDFYTQVPLLIDLLDQLGIPFYETDGYEADDIMATLARQAQNQSNIETFLITSDLDLLQVVDSRTQVYALKTGFSKIEIFTPQQFELKYGIKVAQFWDYKALRGDPSDNIPGVPGVGPKTATNLLQQFASIEEIYANLDQLKPNLAKKLTENRDLVKLSRQLAELFEDAPVKLELNRGKIADWSPQQVATALNKFEFSSLVRRLDKIFPELEANANQPNLFSLNDRYPEEVSVKTTFLKTNQLDKLAKLLKQKTFLIEVISEKIYLSEEENQEIFEIDLSESNLAKLDLVSAKNIVTYDIKSLLTQLASVVKITTIKDLPIPLNQTFEIKQAAFLLNPLDRNPETEPSSASHLLNLKEAYKQRTKALADLPKLAQVAREMDFPLQFVLWLMEQRGVKINQKTMQNLSAKLAGNLEKLERQIFAMAGQEFNLNSPQQLSFILFEVLKLPTQGIKKGKTAYSTSKSELEKLANQHPIIELIGQVREISKLKNTYVDVLPKLADKNDRIHSTFNQNVTATGRLSSSSPNLQNIPIRTELGQEVRAGFVAETGKVLISADYAQFELRLAAALAGDLPMIAIFNTGRDIHTEMAAQIFNLPSYQVSPYQRRVAKIVNFGVLYGIGARSLSLQIDGINYKEAEDLIETYFAKRKAIRQFMDNTLDQAKERGFVETYFGRRRPTPDINSSNFQIREAAKRASANMPIQGTGADLMKQAMIKIEQALLEFDDAQQILQIHDSILIECAKKDAEKITKIIKELMENIYPELKVNLTVDTKIGQTWRDL